jgi:dynein heavy chain
MKNSSKEPSHTNYPNTRLFSSDFACTTHLWSRNYNFNDGDLTICGDVLHNYLTKYEKVPYADLAYIYGEIMYGGHITDGWDRRTNNSYLYVLIRPEILQ